MSGRKGIPQTSAVKDTNYIFIFIIFKTNSRTAAENSAVVFLFGVHQENIPRKVACNKKKRGKKKNEKKTAGLSRRSGFYDFFGTNSIFRVIPIPSAKRFNKLTEGFLVPFSSLLISA